MATISTSIIVPLYNALTFTRQMMATLSGSTGEVLFELIFVDNCSQDGTREFLSELEAKTAKVILNEKNLNFAGACNQGAEIARGKFLVFLNNDTILLPGWLEKMVELAKSDSNIAVVGNKQLYPDSEKVNHAGMFFDERRLPIHYGVGAERYDPRINFTRDMQIVTASCILIRKDIFKKMGGFDEIYQNGYEDVDLCLKIKEAGYRVVYCPESEIFHYGQKSPGRTENDIRNQIIFQERWSKKIHCDSGHLFAEDSRVLRSNITSKLSLPVVIPSQPHRPNVKKTYIHFEADLSYYNSFTWLTTDLVKALFKRNAPVSIASGSFNASIDRYVIEQLSQMQRFANKDDIQIRWTHYTPQYLQRRLNGWLNLEIFVTNYLFTHQRPGDFDYWMQDVRTNGYYKLPISEFSLEALLQAGIPRDMCHILPMGYSPEVLLPAPPFTHQTEHKVKLLAIINSADPKRLGTDILLEAYRKAFSAQDDVVLILKDYAPSPDPTLLQWMQNNQKGAAFIYNNQFLSKTDLIALYRSCDAQVAPFRGEGFAVKIIDGLACGLPAILPLFSGPRDYCRPEFVYPLEYKTILMKDCLDTSNLDIGNRPYWCETNLNSLIEQMQTVATNADEARQRGQRAKEFILNHYSWEHAAEKLITAIDDWANESKTAISRKATKKTQPELSVIIPTYNRSEHFQRCLESLEKQTLDKSIFDVVVVDDGSTDNTANWLKNYKGSLNLYCFVQENSGAAAARNLGIQHARGKIILFIGDDIYPNPRFLADHLSFHHQHPVREDAVVGLTSWAQQTANTPIMDFIVDPEEALQFNYTRIIDHENAGPYAFYTSNISLKKDFLKLEVQPFNETFWYPAFEDIECGYRLEKHGLRLHYRPELLAFHDHETTIEQFCQRQFRAGQMIWLYVRLHNELHLPGVNLLTQYRLLKGNSGFYLDRNLDECLLKIIHDFENSILNLRTSPELPHPLTSWKGLSDNQEALLYGLYHLIFNRAYVLGLLTGPEQRINWLDADHQYYDLLDVISLAVKHILNLSEDPSVEILSRALELSNTLSTASNIPQVIATTDTTDPALQAAIAFIFEGELESGDHRHAGRLLSALELMDATSYSPIASQAHSSLEQAKQLRQQNRIQMATKILRDIQRRFPFFGLGLQLFSEILFSANLHELSDKFSHIQVDVGIPKSSTATYSPLTSSIAPTSLVTHKLLNQQEFSNTALNDHQAADTLQMLLNAADLPKALNQHADKLDNALLELVYSNARLARSDGDLALAEGLDDLAEYINKVISSRSGTQHNLSEQTLQLLLDSADLPAALKLYHNRLDTNLVNLIRESAANSLSSGENELAEGLTTLAEYIVQTLNLQASPHPEQAETTLQILLDADDLPTALKENENNLDEGLLALVRANITAVQADEQYELAEGLKNLAEYIENIIINRSRINQPKKLANVSQPEPIHMISQQSMSKTQMPQLIFIGRSEEINYPYRVELPVNALRDIGYQVETPTMLSLESIRNNDIFVFSRPNLTPPLLESIRACAQAGKTVIIDMDDDFINLPEDHPGYSTVGPGNPAMMRLIEQMLHLATLVTVTTAKLANVYGKFAKRTKVIPNGWSRKLSLWEIPAYKHDQIHLGWAGTITHRQDVLEMRQGIIHIIREFPNTALVIGGDPEVLNLFNTISEKQKKYIPFVSFNEYPCMLANFDILLAPLRLNPFNHAKSDIKLLEAGIRHIPWVASPTEPYLNWKKGGLFANSQKEWYSQLKLLVTDPKLCQELGEAGYQKSLTREDKNIVNYWIEIFTGLGYPQPFEIESTPHRSIDDPIQVLETLLNSDNILNAINENKSKFNIELLNLVRTNASLARTEGNFELASGLDDLEKYIIQILQTNQ